MSGRKIFLPSMKCQIELKIVVKRLTKFPKQFGESYESAKSVAWL